MCIGQFLVSFANEFIVIDPIKKGVRRKPPANNNKALAYFIAKQQQRNADLNVAVSFRWEINQCVVKMVE